MYTNPPVNLHFAEAKAIRFSMGEHSQMLNLAFHGQIWLFYAQKLIFDTLLYSSIDLLQHYILIGILRYFTYVLF